MGGKFCSGFYKDDPFVKGTDNLQHPRAGPVCREPIPDCLQWVSWLCLSLCYRLLVWACRNLHKLHRITEDHKVCVLHLLLISASSFPPLSCAGRYVPPHVRNRPDGGSYDDGPPSRGQGESLSLPSLAHSAGVCLSLDCLLSFPLPVTDYGRRYSDMGGGGGYYRGDGRRSDYGRRSSDDPRSYGRSYGQG